MYSTQLPLIRSLTQAENCKGLSAPRMVKFTYLGVVCSPQLTVLATMKVRLGGYNVSLTASSNSLAVVKPHSL